MHSFRCRSFIFYISIFILFLPCLASGEGLRPWDLSVRLFSGYDDNVPLDSKASRFIGDEESLCFGANLSGAYRIVQTSRWRAGVGASVTQTLHAESDVEDYDLTTVSPNLFAQYSFMAWGKPATTGLVYTYRNDRLGGDDYEQSHALAWNIDIQPARAWHTGLYYRLAYEDFDFEGTDPDRTSRDATSHTIGLQATRIFDRNRRSIMVNYEYGCNDADGDNFEFDSHKILGRFRTLLVRPFWLVLDAAYTDQDYTKYTPEPRRTQNNWNYRAMLLVPLNPKLTADFSYSYAKYDGSEAQFDAERKKVLIGLTYRF